MNLTEVRAQASVQHRPEIEGLDLFALRTGRFKLIDAPRPELYDLRLDPFEERNIFEQRRGLGAALQTAAHADGSRAVNRGERRRR